ncbi:MAG: hypothetical protein P8L44_06125 [Opitutales bacterium]|nr:hypothetical protein [Opitutales bacterium]
MSTKRSNKPFNMFPTRIVKWYSVGLILLGSLTSGATAQGIEAYAKPKEDYNYIYTLDHEYETTLFRSEKFEPIVETEEGFVIMLQLGGKPKLVLLPFDSGDRKVAETKYRGVGVTYTAYLNFTEGHLPFFANKYYEVVKREKGRLYIDYQFKGFRKTIEVPESQFIVRTAFEYHLEESLKDVRSNYRSFEVTQSPPSTWKKVKSTPGPGTMTESPTHIGIAQNRILAGNYQSIRTVTAKELEGVLMDIWVDQHRLVVVPILYTHETSENVFYFVKIRGYERPVLVKEFRAPEESDGYSKVVRVSSNTGEDVRFLEITETMNVEFYPQFHFLVPGQLAAVREGFAGHYLTAVDGEYEIAGEDMKLLYPRTFMQSWGNATNREQMQPSDSQYEELLKFSVPSTARHNKEWQSLVKLQTLAKLYKKIQPDERADVQSLLRALKELEEGAERLSLSLKTNPKRTALSAHNQSYFNFWKKVFNDVNSQAAKERNQDVLRRKLLGAEILIGETDHQALADFLSSQIYTYSNFLPAPLNKFNQLESNPPLASTTIMRFNFPLSKTFKLDPSNLEPLRIISTDTAPDRSHLLKEKYRTSWLLNLDGLKYWQASINAKKEEIYDPEYWVAVQEKAELERRRRLEIARKRLVEVQSEDQGSDEGLLDSPEAPWIASGVWFAILLMTNTGFFALSKMMPKRTAKAE